MARPYQDRVDVRCIVLLTPLPNGIEVPASVPRIEIWPWRLPLLDPGMRDDSDVGIAVELLSEHFDAMI